MKSYIRTAFRRALYKIGEMSGLEKSLLLSGQIRAAQIKQGAKLRTLADAEFSAFSQWGEDGIIEFLVANMPGIPTRFVEFGVEDFRESNCRFLAMNRNWSGLIMDGSNRHLDSFRKSSVAWRHNIEAVATFITAESIAPTLQNAGFDRDIGILSVDIDGVDFWVLSKIDTDAAIVVVEYNDFLGSRPVAVPYRPDFVRAQHHWSNMYWGASLPAFRHLLESRDYVFVGSNTVGTNAFFVKSAYAAGLQEKLESFTAFPCRMRETRKEDGNLAFKTYRQFGTVIDNMEVQDVVTGERMSIGALRQSGHLG
jgi:hypothetical protein